MLTYFTYLPDAKRFFIASRCPKETNSDRQEAVGDGRTAIGIGQAWLLLQVADLPRAVSERRSAISGIPLCLNYFKPYLIYLYYL